MKTVNKMLLSLSVAFSSVSVSGEHGDKRIESIEYVHQKVMTIAGELEKNIEHCSLVRSGSELPKIDSKKLESFGVDKALIVQGLSYLSNRNFELCEGKYRVDLAYQLGVLKNLGDYYEVKLPPIDNIKKAVIYPTNREIEAELIYNNLPIKAKEYISNAVGNEPFNLLKTISVNKLLE